MIASELAVQIKATERAGLTLSGNIPIQDPQPTMPTRLPTTEGAATAEAEESAEDEIKRAVDRAVDDDRS